MTQAEPLNDRLTRWAQTHPTTASDEDRQVREAFVAKFPLEHLRELTLEQYAIGRGDTENFCYWLEWGTGTLGSIRGGAAKKFGVYWSQSKKEYMVNAMFSSPEDAKDRILDAICEAAKCLTTGDIAGADEASARMGDNRYTVRLKPLSLYFPDKLLPISKPGDLQELLRRFGQETNGDQLALNVRLLRHLRERPAASAFDTLGLMRFLYDEYIYVTPPQERRIWKVAPGPNAAYLEIALQRGATFIGSVAEDLSVIPADDMAATLAGLDDPQTAYVASAFAHTMQEGDVVVANQGRSRVVAVGLIDGPYRAPNAEFNPLGDEFKGTDLRVWRHARRVRWLLTQVVDLPAAMPMLAMQSVSAIQEPTLQEILDAYHAHDGSPETALKLTELGWKGTVLPSVEELPDDVRYLIDLAGHTKNIVLYGPPGTGKTRLAREFARAWLKNNPTLPTVPGEAKPLTWRQAVVLALADLNGANVQQIVNHPVVQSLAARRPDNDHVDATVSNQLVTYMHPDDRTSTSVDRRVPYVFTRNEDKSLWMLSEIGQAEAEKLSRGQMLDQPTVTAYQPVQHVTFHPAFTYEEFIEGLRPDGQGNFKVRDGVFKRLCQQAHHNPDQDFVLIIDEINRADTAKTFGELITLIEDDKRTRPGSLGEFPVTLPYSDAPDNLFSVPDNVYLVGTMNTADRSITLMDVALRRRFTFVEVAPQPSLITGVEDGLSLNALLTLLNERLTADLDADHRIGHAYLMGETLGARGVVFRWRHKVVPLLQEYYYARDAALRSLLGETLYLDATRTQVMSDEGLMDALRQWTSAASSGGVQ